MTNTAEDKSLRRYQDVLYIVGTGIMAMGLWNSFKTVLFFTTGANGYAELGNDGVPRAVIIVTFVLIDLIDLALRYYVCSHARAEGLARTPESQGKLYLVLAGFLALGHFVSVLLIAIAFTELGDSQIEGLITAVMDLILFLLMAYMIIAAVRIRKGGYHAE